MILVDCDQCEGTGYRGEDAFPCSSCGGNGDVEAACRDCGWLATAICADGHPRCSDCYAAIAAEARVLLDAIAARNTDTALDRVIRGSLRIASSIAPRPL
jgi:hypothetical protein